MILYLVLTVHVALWDNSKWHSTMYIAEYNITKEDKKKKLTMESSKTTRAYVYRDSFR